MAGEFNLQNLIQAIQSGNQSLVKQMGTLIAQLAAQGPVMPLSSYGEGVWTPTLTLGGGSTGMTFSAQSGAYTRIGRIYHCDFHLVLTAKGSSTGAAAIAGLPAAANAAASAAGCGGAVWNYANLSGLTGQPVLHGAAGAATMALLQAGAAAPAALTDSAFTNTSSLDGSFTFFV